MNKKKIKKLEYKIDKEVETAQEAFTILNAFMSETRAKVNEIIETINKESLK